MKLSDILNKQKERQRQTQTKSYYEWRRNKEDKIEEIDVKTMKNLDEQYSDRIPIEKVLWIMAWR